MKTLVFIAITLLAGCVSVREDRKVCDFQCSVEVMEAKQADRTNRQDYNSQYSAEDSADLAVGRTTAAQWSGQGRDLRVTEQGPQLSVYGPVAASSGSEVALCRHDVQMSQIVSRDRVAEFMARCYDLLPEDQREVFRLADQRILIRNRR